MNLKDLQRNWNGFGKLSPFKAILASCDGDIAEFFATGEKEMALVMEYIESLGINVPRRKSLDFGCGVGRLTQPLANYFDEVYGVDIAPSILELANRFNHHEDKCKYYLNETDDLKLFPDNTFDFIYSNYVLQHMEPRYSKKYIKEFLRILVPHGLLIFQQPSEQILSSNVTSKSSKRLIKAVTRKTLSLLGIKKKRPEGPKMEMYVIKREDILNLLKENGAKIIDITQNKMGQTKVWLSVRYCVTKIGASLGKGSIRFGSQRSNLGVETKVEAVAT